MTRGRLRRKFRRCGAENGQHSLRRGLRRTKPVIAEQPDEQQRGGEAVAIFLRVKTGKRSQLPNLRRATEFPQQIRDHRIDLHEPVFPDARLRKKIHRRLGESPGQLLELGAFVGHVNFAHTWVLWQSWQAAERVAWRCLAKVCGRSASWAGVVRVRRSMP